MFRLYMRSTVLVLHQGWKGGAHVADERLTPKEAISTFVPADIVAANGYCILRRIPLIPFKTYCIGMGGSWDQPLLPAPPFSGPGSDALVRIGDRYRVYRIKDYDHLICLITIFGLMFFSIISSAPQSSSSDTGIMFKGTGLSALRGGRSPHIPYSPEELQQLHQQAKIPKPEVKRKDGGCGGRQRRKHWMRPLRRLAWSRTLTTSHFGDRRRPGLLARLASTTGMTNCGVRALGERMGST